MLTIEKLGFGGHAHGDGWVQMVMHVFGHFGRPWRAGCWVSSL